MVSGTTGSCRAVCMKVHVAQIKPCGRLTMLPQSNKRSQQQVVINRSSCLGNPFTSVFVCCMLDTCDCAQQYL